MVEEIAADNKLAKHVMKEFITPKTARIVLEKRKLKENGTNSSQDRRELSRQVQRRRRHDYSKHNNNITTQKKNQTTFSER